MKILFQLFVLFSLFSCSKEEKINESSSDEKINTPINFPTGRYTVLKSGKFNSSSGYPTSGTGQLVIDSLSKYGIILADDFSTSFATGSVTIYLSKSMNLNLNDSTTFIRVSVVKKNGLHRIPIESKPADDLNVLVVWCQPAGIKFGHADLKK